ncbi:MAG: hypothetical protein ISP01_05220 [Methanobrevibacter arboriphilus]|uniref:Uncharacterized protein n=1 Tax=Methanobrevibacter arboriphilus TaxID=39441 RepID=A0A843AMP2_METAZ|nr:hypothetical protein [Methanobrevibacter arboriphilus]MBF4468788.1 hypothetical protein [Methanobrevibacter arboriphilus]
MLHKMSEVRGWSHEEMLKMDKRTFYRYYGYWYAERLIDAWHIEEEKRKQKNSNKTKDWKPL